MTTAEYRKALSKFAANLHPGAYAGIFALYNFAAAIFPTDMGSSSSLQSRLVHAAGGLIFFLLAYYWLRKAFMQRQYIECPSCKTFLTGSRVKKLMSTGKCPNCNTQILSDADKPVSPDNPAGLTSRTNTSNSMAQPKFQTVVSKVLAIAIVSLLVAWWVQSYGDEQTTKLNTMSSADYIAHKRHVYQLPFLPTYIGMFIFGSIYVLLVEAFAFFIRSLLPGQNSFFREETLPPGLSK